MCVLFTKLRHCAKNSTVKSKTHLCFLIKHAKSIHLPLATIRVDGNICFNYYDVYGDGILLNNVKKALDEASAEKVAILFHHLTNQSNYLF